MDTYEIRRSGLTLCVSPLPGCGYPAETLKAMQRSGLYLYQNGKRVKLS